MKKIIFLKESLLSQEDAAAFSLDEELTLMNWGNATVKRISTDRSGIISGLELKLHIEGDLVGKECF